MGASHLLIHRDMTDSLDHLFYFHEDRDFLTRRLAKDDGDNLIQNYHGKTINSPNPIVLGNIWTITSDRFNVYPILR